MSLEKDLLSHVFRIGKELAAEDGNGETEDEMAMAADQLREGLLVAAVRACNERGIALHQCQRPDPRERKWKTISPTPRKTKGRGETQKLREAGGRTR